MSTYSNWREDLIEVIDTPTTEEKAKKKIKETKVNNKVVINPTFKEAVAEMGGQILEVAEVDDKKDTAGTKEDPQIKSKEKRAGMIKRQVLLKKLQAVRAGGGADITAGYEPEGEMVEASAVLDANTKIQKKEQRKKDEKEYAKLMAIYNHQKDLKKRGLSNSHEPEGEVIEEGIMKMVKKVIRSKKPAKKATMDATTDKLHDWRQKNSDEQKDREKYVSPFRPIVKEGKGYQPEIEHSKLGDAKKKADKERESKLPPHLQGDAIGKMKKAFATEGKKRGLWDNIHAKRKRGEKPAKPGDKDYPKTLNVEGLEKARKNVGADKCWDGYKAKGTKKKGGKEVPNCVKEEDKAYNYVVSKLKKKYGDGVLTKGDKMPEPSAAQKKKNDEIRAKRAKEDGRDATEKASSGRYSDRYSNRGSD
jgi:hypothetical protein